MPLVYVYLAIGLCVCLGLIIYQNRAIGKLTELTVASAIFGGIAWPLLVPWAVWLLIRFGVSRYLKR